MRNTVYTMELVKAITEEGRLNAHPASNQSLYNLLQDTKKVLKHPLSGSIDSQVIIGLQENLTQYPQSFAAQHYRRELSVYQTIRQAQELLDAKIVFDLNEVAYLIRDLGQGYNAQNSSTVQAYRQDLDKLWVLVQKGKLHAAGVRSVAGEEMKEIAEVLKLYQTRSSEISGVHTALQLDLREMEINKSL